MRLSKVGADANGLLRVLLRLFEMQKNYQSPGRRLLRFLFLWLGRVPAELVHRAKLLN
jgi:hypothetical protein